MMQGLEPLLFPIYINDLENQFPEIVIISSRAYASTHKDNDNTLVLFWHLMRFSVVM